MGEQTASAPMGACAGPERWRVRSALGVRTLDGWTGILAETHLPFASPATR